MPFDSCKCSDKCYLIHSFFFFFFLPLRPPVRNTRFSLPCGSICDHSSLRALGTCAAGCTKMPGSYGRQNSCASAGKPHSPNPNLCKVQVEDDWGMAERHSFKIAWRLLLSSVPVVIPGCGTTACRGGKFLPAKFSSSLPCFTQSCI